MTTPVIAYVNPGDAWERQINAILGYAAEHELAIAARCSAPDACALAVAAGVAAVVVASVDPRNGLREAIDAAGGTLRLVRERSRTPSLRDFLAKALGRGKSPREIAHLTGYTTGEVDDMIKRLGLRKPPNSAE
jgi:hypothetical protein